MKLQKVLLGLTVCAVLSACQPSSDSVSSSGVTLAQNNTSSSTGSSSGSGNEIHINGEDWDNMNNQGDTGSGDTYDSSGDSGSSSTSTKQYIGINNPDTSVTTRSVNLARTTALSNVQIVGSLNEAIVFQGTEAEANALKDTGVIVDFQEDIKVKLFITDGVNQMLADKVQNAGITGSGSKVCIIDSGMNAHPDLPTPEAQYDFVDQDNIADDVDEYGHGTSVAGIIMGVAPGTKLYIAKVFDVDGEASSSMIADALEWCVNQNVDVINMSLGHGGYRYRCDDDYTAKWSNDAAQKGIVVLAASGNDGYSNKISSPACGSKVMSVGSVDKSDWVSYFSNGGMELDIVAPGENIITPSNLGGYVTFDGTSAATPFAAGVASLLKSVSSNPNSAQIKAAMINNADDLGIPGADTLYGHGRVNAEAAYNAINTGSGSGTLEFVLSNSMLHKSVASKKYEDYQIDFDEQCPAGHYMADIRIQKSKWFLTPSITWFEYECKAMNETSYVLVGDKRYDGDKNIKDNFCGSDEAITGMEVNTGNYLKDFKIRCSELSYADNTAQNVNIDNHGYSFWAFWRKDGNDIQTKMECPAGQVVVGLSGSTKFDMNEWAMTKVGIHCAQLSTQFK
jgi:subtilisin